MSLTLLESTGIGNSLQLCQRNRVHVPSFPLQPRSKLEKHQITERVEEPGSILCCGSDATNIRTFGGMRAFILGELAQRIPS
jgi:hypothetical protein